MTYEQFDLSDPSQQLRRSLSRWDDEGGAGPYGPQNGVASSGVLLEIPNWQMPNWCNFAFA